MFKEYLKSRYQKQFRLRFCKPLVVTSTYNPASLETKFRNRVGSIPVEGNRPSVDRQTAWPPVIQLQERNLTNLITKTKLRPYKESRFHVELN